MKEAQFTASDATMAAAVPADGGMARLLVWASGYSGKAARGGSLGDLEQLQKLGGTVLFAGAAAGVEWGAASLSFTAGAFLHIQLVIAVLAAAAGAGFVLVFDRTMLFLMDTRVDSRSMGWFLVIRLVVILAFASFTSERVLQVTLEQEMQHTALVMRTDSESARQSDLRSRFGVGALEQREQRASETFDSVQRESRQVPEAIRIAAAQAETCRREVAARRSSLIRAGFTRREAAGAVAGRAAACRQLADVARTRRVQWEADTAERLRIAQARLKDAQERQAAGADAVDQRLSEARSVELEAVRPGSQRVLWQTVVATPAAMALALFVVILSAAVQLLPFTLKSRAGQTGLGAGLGAERESGRLQAMSRLTSRRDEAEVAAAAGAAMAETMIEALASDEFRARTRAHGLEHAATLAPLYAAIHTAREAAGAKREMDMVARSAPELAAFIYGLWTDAIRQVGPKPSSPAAQS